MSEGPRVGRTDATDLTVHNDASEASLTLSRFGDGQIEFTDATTGVRYTSADPRFAKKLFDAINALV